MLITYTLYAHHSAHGVRFEPYMGASEYDALARAQEIMAHDALIHRVDVHLGDAHLFSVARPGHT
jgi:hypothetical protein